MYKPYTDFITTLYTICRSPHAKNYILFIFLLNVNLWTGTSRQWTGPTCASDLLLLGDPLPAAVGHAFSPPSRPRDRCSRVLLRADSLWALGHAKIQTGASSGLHASLSSGQCDILKWHFQEIGKKNFDGRYQIYSKGTYLFSALMVFVVFCCLLLFKTMYNIFACFY
jgi:hypothetical protein